MKRFMALILAALMIVCLGSIAAAESSSTWSSNYFSDYGISLTKTGSSKINITFSCSCAYGTASQIGVSNYYVQKYDADNLEWDTVSGPHDGSYSYGASSHSFAKTFQGVSGEKYRVKCTFLCTKGGTTETKSYTSRTVTLP